MKKLKIVASLFALFFFLVGCENRAQQELDSSSEGYEFIFNDEVQGEAENSLSTATEISGKMVDPVEYLGQFSEQYAQGQLLERQIQAFEEEVQLLQDETEGKESFFEYLKSDQYTDKYAKMLLDLINPGEEVLIMMDSASESEEIYKQNINNLNEMILKIESFFESNNQKIQDIKILNAAREIHIQNVDGTWVWFSLMMDIDVQLQKLSASYEIGDGSKFNEYLDLRIPGKLIYK